MSALLTVLVAICLYATVVAAYRLFLSPVRQFPGPKLAALTFLYEGYYDIIKDGSYTWKIKEMHEKYGPVVRINPSELHVNDPEFYHTLYTGPSRRTDKWRWSARMFGTSQATVGTSDHHLHHMRKAGLEPYFSKSAVSRLEPLIQAKVNLLCTRLQSYCGKGQAVNLSDAFTAFSADVIGSYVFGVDYGFLEKEDFAPEWRLIMTELSRSTHLMKQVGWVYPIIKSRVAKPLRDVASAVNKPLSYLFRIEDRTQKAIEEAKNRSQSHEMKLPDCEAQSTPVMQSLFAAQKHALPDEELTTERLTEEGITLLGAGTVTTAQTLANTIYFIISDPQILKQVRTELKYCYSSHPAPTWSQLSQLPFIKAVVTEGLRLSYGVASRLPRISPDTDLRLPDGRTIPKGTPVSMTHMFLHDNPALFAEALKFRPERWLISDSKDSSHQTSRKFFVPFSRGTRSCLGTNLAWAELHMAIAGLLRPAEYGGVDITLFDTSEEEVRVKRDYFNPAPQKGAVGVRVLVK